MADPIPSPSPTSVKRTPLGIKPTKVTNLRKKWNGIFADPTACATVCIAIFTIVTVVVSYFQWQALREANQVNRDSLASIQRAFIAYASIETYSHYETSTGELWWFFDPIWENAGNTPTRNMRSSDNSYFGSTPLPQGFSFPELPGNVTNNEMPSLLGPKGQILGETIQVTGKGLAEVQAGRKYFYIWGCTKYHDVFSGTPEHVTKFAVKVSVYGNPTLPSGPTNPVGFDYTLLPKHNCADGECDKQ
jgi:hypothetical protein